MFGSHPMGDRCTVRDLHKRHLFHRTSCTCIFLIICLDLASFFAVSQDVSTGCVLSYKNRTTPGNLTCEEGTWGGFLTDKCCKKPFEDYLYALAWHSNQTGSIYLESSEQGDCLAMLKGYPVDIMSCGFKRLTHGGGGCLDFNVNDVNNRLGKELRRFTETCGFLSYGDWNKLCSACTKSWEDIDGIGSDDDSCRFAALTSSTSTMIYNSTAIQRIYKCLGDQYSRKDSAEMEKSSKGSNISKTVLHILIGVLSGISASVFISVFIFSRIWRKTHAPKDDGLKRALPKKSRHLRVPLKEVHYATNNLNQSNLIGEGTAGKVYKGTLSNNQHVAVKHIIDDGFMETFLREVRNLALIRHPNLVPLLGYCDNGDECFIIYELCSNGNLSEWLFGKDKVLSWIQRLEIAIDCARGLWFLHTYAEGCIVHRDIKPTNILLGPNFEAKLSDFGLSKAIDLGETNASSEVRGTFGYVDPEYQSDHQVNSAGDVYSFGIVLLQIISGRRVINMNVQKPMPLEKMAKSLTRNSSIVGFADPKLDGEYSAEAFELTFKLALSCTGLKQERPTMERVVERLEKAHNISINARISSPQTTTD